MRPVVLIGLFWLGFAAAVVVSAVRRHREAARRRRLATRLGRVQREQ